MFPTIELHNHLEGTISPELAQKLAKRNRLPFPQHRLSADGSAYVYQDFLDFLKAFDTIADLIKHPIDYYDLTLDYLVRNAQQGAIYIETMYSPDHAEKTTGIPSLEHLHAIQQAIDDAESQTGIIGRVLMTGVRHFGAEATEKVAQEALRHRLPCVVGFGLGGDEIHYPPEQFKRTYAIASEGGLACTIHAGEFSSAESMLLALKTLPIKRVGHGVAAIHCPEVMALLKDRQIILEICPSSNLMLGLFPSLQAHPLPQLMQAGIHTCLNSDDPPFFHTHLANEYERVRQAFQFSPEVMLTFTRNACEAAFADEATKQTLRERLMQWPTP